MLEPDITPLAKRLAEDAGVAWWRLDAAAGPVTERDVLAHLSSLMVGAAPLQADTQAEIDFGGLAASLSQAMEDLLAGSDDALPGVTAEASFGAHGAHPLPPGPTLVPTPPEAVSLQAQLEAERLAHAETKARLEALGETLKRQKTLASQLRPLSGEIRRLGSALGWANAEIERLRPLGEHAETLKLQLEQAQLEETRTRLLCRALQEQRDGLEAERRRGWRFWRR